MSVGLNQAWGDEGLAVAGEGWVLETLDKEELAEFCDWRDIGDEGGERG